jgi:hypothetical protein
VEAEFERIAPEFVAQRNGRLAFSSSKNDRSIGVIRVIEQPPLCW